MRKRIADFDRKSLEKSIFVPVPAGRHFSNFFRPDSGTPRYTCFYSEKKANSFVPAIFFPMAWPFWKKGGDWCRYTFLFSPIAGGRCTQAWNVFPRTRNTKIFLCRDFGPHGAKTTVFSRDFGPHSGKLLYFPTISIVAVPKVVYFSRIWVFREPKRLRFPGIWVPTPAFSRVLVPNAPKLLYA